MTFPYVKFEPHVYCSLILVLIWWESLSDTEATGLFKSHPCEDIANHIQGMTRPSLHPWLKSIAPPARKKLTATPQLRTAPLTVLRQLQTHSTLMHRLSMPVPLLLLAFMNRKGQDTCAANELLTDHSATRREPCDIPCGWWAIFTLQEHLFKFKLLRKLYLEVDWKLFLVDWKSFFIGCFKEYWSTNLFSTHLKLSLFGTC